MSEFRLPELGHADSATIGRWRKQPGDAISAHETLLEVFSERFDWDVPSPSEGVLKEIVAAEGAQVRPGAVLAVIDAAGAGAGPHDASATAGARPHVARAAVLKTERLQPAGAAQADGPAHAAESVTADVRAMRVSPLAARIAADRQVDLEQAHGSGPAGRVSKDDVLALLAKDAETAGRSPAPAPHAASDTTLDTAPTVAPDAAPNAAPEAGKVRAQTVSTFIAVDMTHAAKQRETRRAHWRQREGTELEFLPFVVQAAVAALRAAPIGSDGNGTTVEVVQAGGSARLHDAETLNLVGIARRLAEDPSSSTRRPMHRSSFAPPRDDSDNAQALFIEDHGASGALLSTGLLAPGAAGLLSVGTVHRQVVAAGESLDVRPVAYFGLTFDPTQLDEARAGKFMAELKRLLETGSFS